MSWMLVGTRTRSVELTCYIFWWAGWDVVHSCYVGSRPEWHPLRPFPPIISRVKVGTVAGCRMVGGGSMDHSLGTHHQSLATKTGGMNRFSSFDKNDWLGGWVGLIWCSACGEGCERRGRAGVAGAYGKLGAQKRQVRTYFWLERAGNRWENLENAASQGREWAVKRGEKVEKCRVPRGEPEEDEPEPEPDPDDDDDDDHDHDHDDEEEEAEEEEGGGWWWRWSPRRWWCK